MLTGPCMEPAAASSPSIDILRSEIVILDITRKNVAAELVNQAGSRYSRRDSSRYINYLDLRISDLCSQAASIGGPSVVADLPCPAADSLLPGFQAPVSPGSSDRIRAIDQALLESLGNFDELLAAEQQKIMARRPEAAGSAPSEPGASPGRRGMQGGGTGAGGRGGQGSPGTQGGGRQGGMQGATGRDKGQNHGGEYQGTTEPGSDREGSMPGGMQGTTGTAGREGTQNSQSSASGSNTGTQPGTVAGGRTGVTGQEGGPSIYADDDIVARQLREAAEKETDPELKKKLWEEYRKYKETNR